MPHCPQCKKEIAVPDFDMIEAKESDVLLTRVALAYCPHCGCILGIASQEQCQAE
jgi:uncharacterized protein with PIN domain